MPDEGSSVNVLLLEVDGVQDNPYWKSHALDLEVYCLYIDKRQIETTEPEERIDFGLEAFVTVEEGATPKHGDEPIYQFLTYHVQLINKTRDRHEVEVRIPIENIANSKTDTFTICREPTNLEYKDKEIAGKMYKVTTVSVPAISTTEFEFRLEE